MKTYRNSKGEIYHECLVCGQYMEKKYLNNHSCPENRNDVEMIENLFMKN